MSKSILIIDTPNACWECMLCGRGIKERFCIARIYEQGNANDCDIKDLNKVESWCPLKHLPIRITKDHKDLEIWNSRNGYMLAPKGLFDEIYNDKEDDDEGNR